MARDGLDLLRATLWSFLDVWKAAAKTGGRFRNFWVHRGSRRPGGVRCSSGRIGPSGRLLEVWRSILGG